MLKTWVLTRAPETEGQNQDGSLKLTYTLGPYQARNQLGTPGGFFIGKSLKNCAPLRKLFAPLMSQAGYGPVRLSQAPP